MVYTPPQDTPPNAPEAIAQTICVGGTVQGVGFRPMVYRLAHACGLRGLVWNDGQGVQIIAQGAAADLDRFVAQMQAECPPLAHIERITRQPYTGTQTFTTFAIAPSLHTAIHTDIVPDAATCAQCRSEIGDATSRWYRYPFTNCTHCGPRLSIIRSIPYDRANTSMAPFAMCDACAREYADVSDRRFHAQPIACPRCGPQVWLEQTGRRLTGIDPLEQVPHLLTQGAIVAIKGLGGFHLACDATDEAVVQRLRQRKHRPAKPLAVMARDLAMIETYAEVSEAERAVLQSPAAPIVLLRCRAGATRPLAPSIAPGLNRVGWMLPYTPLHHLIWGALDRPIVLTSGNDSDEPQCLENQAARDSLGAIADYLLLHDRAIVNRVDDSVVRVDAEPGSDPANRPPASTLRLLRRARGYAPAPIALPPGFEAAPPLIAMGSTLKATICLIQPGRAILSQHLGNLDNAAAIAAYQDTVTRYQQLFAHRPQAIAVDQHPDYWSHRWGNTLAAEADPPLPLYPVQHHHAHIAACLVEHQVPLTAPPVLGIALDGLGYGDDGSLWGGEFLLADYHQARRVGRLKPVALLGGDQAVYQPWRNTYAQLVAALGWEAVQQTYGTLDLVQFLDRQPRALLDQMLTKQINAPLASSAGRLFDAIAAAVGLCRERATYEGQGAIELEALIDAAALHQGHPTPYPFAIAPMPTPEPLWQLDPQPLWPALLTDLQQGASAALIAARFHTGLAQAIAQMVERLRSNYEFSRVILTGGVFQNVILSQQVTQRLTRLGVTVLTHSQVPPNDGGLSLGQGAIAAAHLIRVSSGLPA